VLVSSGLIFLMTWPKFLTFLSSVIPLYVLMDVPGESLVTKKLCALRLRMEESASRCEGCLNIWNKQLQTADKGWSSSLGVGLGVNSSSLGKLVTKCCVELQA
jgi:hypothetical protein